LPESRARNIVTFCIFAASAALLAVFHGNRLVATNDEGLILEPAQRILGGARPYVDIFGYMTPGSYWLQALVFRVFGLALWTGRLIVIFDFSLQCALVFWLTWRIASRNAAIAAALMFAGFQIADPSALTATHRWDSATLALAGVAAAVSDSKSRWLASGALLAAAAWCTPALAAVGGAVILFLAVRSRRDLVPFAAGIASITIPAVVFLLWTGSFRGLLNQLAWLRANYSALNVMPYGSIIGGYRALFEGSAGAAELGIRGVLVACIALPAILPPIAVISMAILRPRETPERRPAIELLTLAAIAFVATVFPRADIAHLAFVAALPYALSVAGIARLLPARAGAAFAMPVILLAAVFGSNFFTSLRATTPIVSPVGALRVPSTQANGVAQLLSRVRPGSSLFVYPYMPLHYFLTQAKNPTRYSFLAPGMMTERDSSAALAELKANPPQFVMYMSLKREEFLRVFPNARSLDWHFATLEKWLDENYEATDPAVWVWGYNLRHRKAACLDPRPKAQHASF